MSETSDLASEGTGVQTAPYRLQDWYERQMEYRTVPRSRSEVMVRYNFEKGLYLRFDAASYTGYELQYLNSDEETEGRLVMTLSVGLDF